MFFECLCLPIIKHTLCNSAKLKVFIPSGNRESLGACVKGNDMGLCLPVMPDDWADMITCVRAD